MPAQNWVAREIDYGYTRRAYWHGVDTTVNARLRNGLIFQGGTSTGRGVRDRCEILEKVPELFERSRRCVWQLDEHRRAWLQSGGPLGDQLSGALHLHRP